MLKISIVTAVRNREATISQAILSLQQQIGVNIEHIIIDGASSDNTLRLVKQVANSNAIVVSEPDEGIYYALNKGIALASGDIIGLMHSDDFYADNYVLADVLEAFDDPTISAVYGDLDYVSDINEKRVIRHWTAGEYRSYKLRLGWMPPHPTLFLRRSVILSLGAFNTRYHIAADYDSILRYLGQGNIKSRYIPRVLVKMRIGGESNRSLAKILLKSREDYLALRANRAGGLGTLMLKNFRKISQFWRR